MSTFEDRLQQFIQLENLTPAKLADNMGVQRGGISHLLTGRNKPSFDFITRLIELYPNLNSEWLLLGKGTPLKSQPESQNSFIPELDFEPQKELLIPEPKEVTKEIPVTEPRENRVFGNKTITRLTIFYSDGTYEER